MILLRGKMGTRACESEFLAERAITAWGGRCLMCCMDAAHPASRNCGSVTPPLRAGIIDWDLRRIKVQIDSSEYHKQDMGLTNVFFLDILNTFGFLHTQLLNVFSNKSRHSTSADLSKPR